MPPPGADAAGQGAPPAAGGACLGAGGPNGACSGAATGLPTAATAALPRRAAQVYRLITKGTVDQNIYNLSQRKLRMDSAVLDGITTGKGGKADESAQMGFILHVRPRGAPRHPAHAAAGCCACCAGDTCTPCPCPPPASLAPLPRSRSSCRRSTARTTRARAGRPTAPPHDHTSLCT